MYWSKSVASNIPNALLQTSSTVVSTSSLTYAYQWIDFEFNGIFDAINMGIGMVLIVDKNKALAVKRKLKVKSWLIGEVVKGNQKVVMI